MKNVLLFLSQLVLLWAIYQFSSLIVGILHLPIPSSVLGMILLYLLLTRGVIQVRFIEKGANFLIKHLALFFVPFAIGLMNYTGLIKTSGVQLMLMIAGSTIIGLLITAGLTQSLSKREKERTHHEQSHSHSH
ncbi:CidA/LrgA family protein [Bacillus sp. ISL-47]|uniref:CidA/LrgA family protein n=1 Tax=Bacillus sp. ISL-47 TaxID=2819130 RepID=UPI001BE8EAD6|nr:CidA/LrgA family protein [Pseudomonas sp. ISL-84]